MTDEGPALCKHCGSYSSLTLDGEDFVCRDTEWCAARVRNLDLFKLQRNGKFKSLDAYLAHRAFQERLREEGLNDQAV